MYKSSRTSTYFYKYGFLVFALAIFILWASLQLVPNAQIKINGIPQPVNFWNTIIYLVGGFIFTVPYLSIGRKLSFVELENDLIRTFDGKMKSEYNWTEVSKIKSYGLTLPFFPIYRFKIKGVLNPIYFCSGDDNFLIPLNQDTSKMGRFIEDKRKELGK